MNASETSPIMFLRRLVIRICLLWIFISSTALGGGVLHGPSKFLTRFWQAEDGLPDNAVNAIVQTRDGYLWVGTPGGLARFDGIKFESFDENNTPELKSSHITSLFEDAAGNLWIGHETGELTCYKDGRFESVPINPAWNKPKIWHIGSDPTGDLWLVNEEGVFFRVRDGLTQSPIAGNWAGFSFFNQSASGHMWIACDGVLSSLQNGRLVPLQQFNQASLTNSYVQGVCPSSDGGLWVESEGRLRKWKVNQWVEDLGASPWEYSCVSEFIELRNGMLAIGTVDHGLYLVQPHGETMSLNSTNGLLNNWVRSLVEDREGNLWVGTGSAGLVMVRPTSFRTLEPPDHFKDRAVLSVSAGLDGDLWVGSEGAGLYRYYDKQWTNWDFAAGVSNPYLWSVSADSRGQVWLGTWGSGLLVKRGDHFGTAPGWQDVLAIVTALLRRADGDYWIGTGRGLLRYQDGNLTLPIEKVEDPFLDVRAVVEETNGTVWVGMNGLGLGRLENGRARLYHKSDGLASEFVTCLHLDDEGSLWIGTLGGLNRLKSGRLATINLKQGLPNNFICDIEDDGRGCFWISSHGGIMRVQKRELNRCADGVIQSARFDCYGVSDGLPTTECSGGFQPAGCATTNGWIYFPTSKGVVAVNPDEIRINPLAPPVVLEDVLMDDRRVSGSTNKAALLRIPPGQHRFEFRYTGLSFAVPENVKFKYRLDGIDSDWISVGTKRAVNFNFLPPGHYTFHVIACNNDGIWNDHGAECAFIILPYFWQTTWFQCIILAVVAGAASAGMWYRTRQRMRHKLEQLERQGAVERERARIAKDIHDDLGANLTRINLLSQSVRRAINNPPEAIKDVDRIGDSARHLIRTMEEIVWAVDPQHDTLDSLISYIGKVTQELFSPAGVRYRLDFPAQIPPWPLTAELRHNLFLAFKEAVHNVVKHSAATEVHISLVIEPAAFKLIVEDNGSGFHSELSPEGSTPQGNRRSSRKGLTNMRQRLREIGGCCEIRSEHGHGTRVSFLLQVNKVAV